MKILNSILLLTVLTINPCWPQKSKNRISVNIPTVEQEATLIWRTINDIEFLEKQGYTINLPNDNLIDSLISKSRNGTFGNRDFPLIYNLLESKVYDKNQYSVALEKVREQEQFINGIIRQIELSKKSWDWDFKMFDNYNIIFTLYGSGGSYDPDAGTVTLLTTSEGNFRNYTNPANTIIHEMVHMGMEQSIIQKHNLSHGLKERIVDTFVFLMFNELLPDYKIQNMGDTQIDAYLKEQDDLKNLDSILEEYMNHI